MSKTLPNTSSKRQQSTRVGLYARVSTSDGRQDAEVQLTQLRRYCKQRGFTIHKEYVDHMSGAKEDRPAYQQLLKDARQRNLDAVLVWKFDRFARSTKALVMALDEFMELKVDFISYSEQVDTSTPMGKAMFTMISAMAEFERSLIQERVVAGLARARERGIQLGRPRVGFDATKAIKLHQQGLGVRRIAKQLGVSYSTVHRFLSGVAKTSASKLTV
ncbi:hypothetical protein BVX97_02645 [bacterium E08(2017)]|nr:hypothetical protein BVX97_02645 [bacterium E08(2017)]